MKIQAKDFNLAATLESGQVFGFRKIKPNQFEGSVLGYAVKLTQSHSHLEIEGSIPEKTARRYFDLERDLGPIYRLLEQEGLVHVCAQFKGLRLIQQDPWEALACFILSSNNNVKRIQGIWWNLSRYFNSGTDGERFPSASQIALGHEKILRDLGLGYRAPFLLQTARYVANNPMTLQCIREAGYEEAKSKVLAFAGIGEKVADCVLLYGFQKYEAFPVDVWMLRVMRHLYFKNRKVDEKKIHDFAQKKWGRYAGYVQQYLFHGVRMGAIIENKVS